MEGHCLQAMKTGHRHANGCFSWLISEHDSVSPPRIAIPILSWKYKIFTFVHPLVAGGSKLVEQILFEFYFEC